MNSGKQLLHLKKKTLTKILLLSDTHSYLDERILHYAAEADEIWHAGDFGTIEVCEQLQTKGPLKGVFGNIDGTDLRALFPEILRFKCEQVHVLMIHIGGYPGKYSKLSREELAKEKPTLFISGHSHILKAQFDSKNQLLHLNPGAAGKTGWHKTRTMMRFDIDGKEIKNLEIIELGTRSG